MKNFPDAKAAGYSAELTQASSGVMLSPLIHLIDDDEAVRHALALLISTVGLRVQSWADPAVFIEGFDR